MVWTLRQAAEACGVSVDTVKRRLKALEEAGAYKDKSGAWKVTPDQLRAVGLTPGAPRKSPSAVPQGKEKSTSAYALGVPVVDQEQEELRRRIAELETALTVERVKREAAEALAGDRDRTIEMLSVSLRMLESGHSQSLADESEPWKARSSRESVEKPARSSGWWSRLRGR